MSHRIHVVCLAIGAALLAGSVDALEAQAPEPDASATTAESTRYGFAIGGAVGASPLGEVAERHGIFGVPGRQLELRAFARTPRRGEWSLALLLDDYHIGRRVDRATSYAFDYDSRSVVVGYRAVAAGRETTFVYGLDAGWLHYSAAVDDIDYYTGEPQSSSMTADAAVVGLSAEMEVPGETVATVPRIRVEMNFPDFGGGDGYSPLHTETDLGIKASLGIALKVRDLF